MDSASATNDFGYNARSELIAYDYMGRRFMKAVGGVTNTYVYDGWAMIRESDGTATNSYAYGPDLSGSMQGAGTIGGLLWASLNGTNAFYCYDANGNVTELVGTNGALLATYEYEPFGNIIRSTGPAADDNPFRFSTKYHDDETGLVYYGFRYYDPVLGRWLRVTRLERMAGRTCMGSWGMGRLGGSIEWPADEFLGWGHVLRRGT